MSASIWIMACALVIVVGAYVYRAYRRDAASVAAELAQASSVKTTRFGPIEYARTGAQPSVLVIHGAGGGYDEGLLIAQRDLAADVGVIAPSRFGYLRTPFRPDASPQVQADAHAALLNALDIGRIVVLGFSAGTRSALQLALRHPHKVAALILVSPVLAAPFHLPDFNRVRYGGIVRALFRHGADFIFWLSLKMMPALMIHLFGAPYRDLIKAPRDERENVEAMVRSMHPLSLRTRGLAADACNVTEDWPLEDIEVETLVIAAQGDIFNALAAAQAMAARIPRAKLMPLAGSGHLLLGHHAAIRTEVAAFLARVAADGVAGAQVNA